MEREVKERGQIFPQQTDKGLQVGAINQPVGEDPKNNHTQKTFTPKAGVRLHQKQVEYTAVRASPEALVDPQSCNVVFVVVEFWMGSQQTLKHLECREEQDRKASA